MVLVELVLGLMPTMTIELSWYMAAHSRELSVEKSTLNYCWMFYFTQAKAAGYRMVTGLGPPQSYWSLVVDWDF